VTTDSVATVWRELYEGIPKTLVGKPVKFAAREVDYTAELEGFAKIVYKDGSVVFAVPKSEDCAWDEEKHPRRPEGTEQGGTHGGFFI
jgi:hypothetical protein